MTRAVGVGVMGMGWMGPADPFHRSLNPAWGLALGHDDTKAIEAFKFLESITSGVQGEPGFREAAAAARVQGAVMRSWDTEHWQPVTTEE